MIRHQVCSGAKDIATVKKETIGLIKIRKTLCRIFKDTIYYVGNKF